MVSSGCPCLALVDRHLVATVAEWNNVTDYTPVLQVLAARGHLQTVEIANRRLETLPDEMRTCTHIQELSVHQPQPKP